MLRDRKVEAHQHSRPDDRVESYDLFSYQMVVDRPELLVHLRDDFRICVRHSERCYIVSNCVEPYVDDVLRIERYRDAPVETRSRYAQVVEALLDEADHLVPSRLRSQELGVLFEVLEQSVSVFAHLEEVSILARVCYRSAAVRAASVYELLLCPE